MTDNNFTPEEYNRMVELLHKLDSRASEIAREQCGHVAGGFHYTEGEVEYSYYWHNTEECEYFPAAWLFDPDWKQRVAEDKVAREAATKLSREREQQRMLEAQEARERQQLARLKAKYE